MNKPPILFRALMPSDHMLFHVATSYRPGPGFGGVVAYKAAYDGEHIMGMVGLDGWTKTAVSAHWYIRNPRCLDPLWREVVAYLRQHGYIKILGAVPSDHYRVLRMLTRRLGWRQVARIEDGSDIGIDMMIFEYPIRDTVHIASRAIRHKPPVVHWRTAPAAQSGA